MDTLLIEIVTPARLEAAMEACVRLLGGHSGTEGSEQSCVRLGESPGKGLGVFATRACEKGEVLTTYPAHAVGRMCGGGRMAWTTRQEYSHSHLDRMACDYALALPGKHIAGDPDLHEEGLGHMINDGARSRSPADVAVYRRVSLAKQNAVPSCSRRASPTMPSTSSWCRCGLPGTSPLVKSCSSLMALPTGLRFPGER